MMWLEKMDIMLRDEANQGAVQKLSKKTAQLWSHISYRIRYSFRAYASMLYLRRFSNFKIILREKPVAQFNIADELKYSEVIRYKPQQAVASNEATVVTTIGFIKEAPSLKVSGFNVYHKNRLIKPFWKVVSNGSLKGMGVVGVLETNFIEPAHDKQDFERSLLFVRLEAKLKQITVDYWKGHCHLVGYQPLNFRSQNVANKSRIRRSAGHSTNSQNELLADQQDIGLVAEHQNNQSLSHEQHGTSVGTPGPLSVDEICEENIKLFMRCEEYRLKETELKQTVVNLEEELKEIQNRCAYLTSVLEAKKKQRVVKAPLFSMYTSVTTTLAGLDG
ncbi:hypothetical protein VNO77_02084 [Canavalia gladiata]|uniref:Morc S5 domain-containing protein n=1 Tax=Canavalia gladiata TaxID=3824 RepID=A0AAN9RAY2_CANGL